MSDIFVGGPIARANTSFVVGRDRMPLGRFYSQIGEQLTGFKVDLPFDDDFLARMDPKNYAEVVLSRIESARAATFLLLDGAESVAVEAGQASAMGKRFQILDARLNSPASKAMLGLKGVDDYYRVAFSHEAVSRVMAYVKAQF